MYNNQLIYTYVHICLVLSPNQHSYLKNISTFLHICKSKFRIKESDLFIESDLYDVDNFQKVCVYVCVCMCVRVHVCVCVRT